MIEAYRKEEEIQVKKWTESGMLEKLPEHRKGPIAILLENQRLINEVSTETGDTTQFKRISLPIVRRMCGWMKCFDMVSIQPMLGPMQTAHHLSNGHLLETDIAASTMKMKATWTWGLKSTEEIRQQRSLEGEAELTAVLAMELALEFDRMVTADLVAHAAVKKNMNFKYLPGSIPCKFNTIREQISKSMTETSELYHAQAPNWIVCSREMAKAVLEIKEKESDDPWFSCLALNEVGVWDDNGRKVKVFTDPTFPTGQILMGRKGENNHDSGYVFSPYVPLTQTPIVLNPDTFLPRYGLMSRFGKKLVDPTYYSLLTVDGFEVPKD